MKLTEARSVASDDGCGGRLTRPGDTFPDGVSNEPQEQYDRADATPANPRDETIDGSGLTTLNLSPIAGAAAGPYEPIEGHWTRCTAHEDDGPVSDVSAQERKMKKCCCRRGPRPRASSYRRLARDTRGLSGAGGSGGVEARHPPPCARGKNRPLEPVCSAKTTDEARSTILRDRREATEDGYELEGMSRRQLGRLECDPNVSSEGLQYPT